MTVSAGTGFGGSGTIMDPVVCQGTIAASPSAAIILMNGLQLSGTGNVALGTAYSPVAGTLYVNDPASGMSGGSLSMNNLVIGASGTGVFTQTVGVNSAVNLNVGYGNLASYNLSAGLISAAGSEFVGAFAQGNLLQTGGTNTANSLAIGYSVGGSGTYSLSGSGLLSMQTVYDRRIIWQRPFHAVRRDQLSFPGTFSGIRTPRPAAHTASAATACFPPPTEYIGYSGSGSFTQSGGTNTTTSSLLPSATVRAAAELMP